MKKFGWVLLSSLTAFALSLGFNSCKKINETTELGGNLIPAVDNINTFDTTLEVETNNRLLAHDSTKILYGAQVALGSITNDPVFGKTDAAIYFDVLPQTQKVYPFYNKDSALVIDSAVLSLSYTGAYGDTSAGSLLSVQVKEISQLAKFNDSSIYRVDHPDFITTGTILGSKTIAFNQLKDTITYLRKIGDTVKTANEVRIKIDPSLIQRFQSYDTTNAYKSDSLFHAAFSGFKIEATGTTKALAYFNLADQAKTKLTFYYRTSRNGVKDTSTVAFTRLATGSRANTIRRTRSGDFATYLNNNTFQDDKVFIQSGSPGSVATINIPGLSTLSNRVIHRAELIISKIPSAGESLYPPPPALFLDQIDLFDVGSSITDDLSSTSSDGATPSFTVFGGGLRADSTYRFNLTRHVQGIITKKESNNLLRLYAPLYTIVKALPSNGSANRLINILPQIAYGRVVLGGGNYADPTKKMKLRIIYSRL